MNIPYHENNLNYFNYEADRYGEYYFLIHGNGSGPHYLQKINVNTFEIVERRINTTYSFRGVYAVNENLVLFRLCVPILTMSAAAPSSRILMILAKSNS